MVDDFLHQAMLCPATYPEKTGPIGFKETHISRLYFTEQHVYKIKKAVNFGFLNFTTLDRRRFYCQEEIRLNSRFCSDTYLGVVEIRRQAKTYRIGQGNGEIVDYAVLMRRLPQERMLDALLYQHEFHLEPEINRLGDHIARLHLGSEARQLAGGRTHLDTIRLNWAENIAQTLPFVGDILPTDIHALIDTYGELFFQQHGPLLLRREEAGLVIDGHGDLHTEHICLTDPICIYDCIEFNERFRVGDRLNDLAFLLMDLEHRDRRDLAEILLEAYQRKTGPDDDLAILLPFYKIYRAWVRGKVFALFSRDTDLSPKQQQTTREEARDYFSLAIAYLCPPTLILTCGLMGTGKTTIANQLARHLGAPLLRTDELRKQLRGLSPQDRDHSDFGQGLYAPETTEATYQALLDETIRLTARGRSVIVDASFASPYERERFRQLAREAGLRFRILWVECQEATALLRLEHRTASGLDASDGRTELYQRQKAIFVPPAGEDDVLPVDTMENIAYNVQSILCNLAQREPDATSAQAD